MVSDNILYVIVVLIASSLAIKDESANVYLSSDNDTESRLEFPPRIDIDDSAIVDEDRNPRDKRALGVILQGLVEALGYTVSPISYASLPNPNATSPAPPPKPIATSGSAPMTTTAPRQRETLRFTGVVNFGNNTDLLGHLQQYERIFHGNATSTAAPVPARPPPTPGPASGKPALLTPYFVPIPLPLAPNLPPLPPSAPRRAKTELTYAKQNVKENYGRESHEISDVKDVRKDPPGRDSDRDTYIDEPRWKKKQRKQEDETTKYREENDREAESSEENDAIGVRNKYGERETIDREEDAEDSEKNREIKGKESVEEVRDDDERGDREDDEVGDDSREGDEEIAKKSEDSEDDRDDRPVESKDDDEDTTSRSDYDGPEKPSGYSPTKCPTTPKQFGNRLPIRVFDEPFSIRGELRNSYGESLEQDGKIDESVADFFRKYKHPESGLFDSRKVESLQGPRVRDHWWSNDRASSPGTTSDPLERIRQEYAPAANKKYDEYNSERKDDEGGEEKGQKDEPKGTYDEEVESTEVKSGPVKGREGSSTTPKSAIQYPRVPASRRYEEYNSERNDGGVGDQRGRKPDSEGEEYDEGVESTEAKYRPVTGRGRGRTFQDTIQQPRVLANERYEEFNPKRNDGEEQRSREEDHEERKYDERAESTEVKSRPVQGQGRGRTFKNTIQQPRVPADSRYEEYNPKRNDGEEHRSREEDHEERKYGERAESTEVKSRPVQGQGRGRKFKNTIQQPRVPADPRYEEFIPKRNDGEEQRSGEEDHEERKYGERAESTEVKSGPVQGRGRGRTFKNTIQQPRVPADSRYEEYNPKTHYVDVEEQRSRNEDPEERKYDERAESTEVTSRPVKGREGTTTSKNTIQHGRVPSMTWYEQYNSDGKVGEGGDQKSRKKHPEEYNEGVVSTEPNYGPVRGRGRGRTFKNIIQQPRVPDSRHEEYDSKSDEGAVGEQRSRKGVSEEKEYDERAESTEPMDRSAKGRERSRTSKNTVQHPRAPATTRYEEYNLPRDEVGEQRGRKEDPEDKDYDGRVQATYAKYRPVKGREGARTFMNYGEDERAGPTVENGRTEVREKKATSTDEDAMDVVAEPTETTYTRINSLEEIGRPNYEDGSEEAVEASQYEPSSERINLPDYDSVEESTSLSKFQLLDPKNPLVFKGFDFIKYSPYFRPIQVSYEPAKLQRTAARILYDNFGDDASDDKSRSSEQLREKNIGSPQRLAAGGVGGDEYITHNPYLKPIQVAYEPEKLQRTADRILSYHNALGPDKSLTKIPDEEESKEYQEEDKEREEERKEEDLSEHNSKDSDGPTRSSEEQDGRSTDNGREEDGPSRSYGEQDGRSADTAPEDDGPSENYQERENSSADNSYADDGPARNYEDRENSSAGNSKEDDAPSRNYAKPEDRSSVDRKTENDVKPGVGLPERLTGKKLHEGESKELRAWPAPFDHTFDSTERAKVVRLPKSEISTKIRDEDVEPTYETPALLEFQSTRATEYPADSDVSPTYETRWSVQLRTSGPTGHHPLDSDVSPTDESPSVNNSPSPEARSNSKYQRRPHSEAKKSSVPNDDLEEERKQSRVTKVDARIRATLQTTPHRAASESPNSRTGDPTIRLQIFEPSEGNDFSEEAYRSGQQRDIGVVENLRPPVQPRKFDDPESAHDFFGFGRDDYVLTRDANNAPKYGEHVQKTTTPSESSEKELMGLLVISHDPNHQHEVTLTKFTDEPETETERVKVNEYRNKVATLKISEQRQSIPHGPVRHVGFTRSL